MQLKEKTEMMPVPTHLKQCVVPDSENIDDSALHGIVRCPCGAERFQMLYTGQTHEYKGEQIPCTAEIGGKYFFLITAKCTTCQAKHLLIDKDFHGWDGFVCHDPEQAALPRPPLQPWTCLACGGTEHQASVDIQTEGKADFVENVEGEFPEDRWPDGFGWIDISITCSACGQATIQWVSYETM